MTAGTCGASSSLTDSSAVTSGSAPRAALADGPGSHAPVGRERYILDGRVRRLGHDGAVLFGGEPFRLLRLGPGGVRALDRLLAGDRSEVATSPGEAAVARCLVAAGMLHLLPAARKPAPDELTVVVPVRDDEGPAARLLAELRGSFVGQVIVVDDGSRPLSSASLESTAKAAGAVFVRRPGAGGAAAARNTARPLALTPLVAYIDADVLPQAGWLDRLVGHFDDPAVAAVAPRVRAAAVGKLGAYEPACSPLDLGPAPGIVGAHRRVSYVPSAAIVCRRQALEDIGWFDGTLAVGEDVDLLRRLEEAGWEVRYDPRSVVWHDSRSSVAGFVLQRFGYGTSAAALERRHPGTVAPFKGNPRMLGGVLALLVALGGRGAGARRLAGLVAWLGLTVVPARSLSFKFRRFGLDASHYEALRAVVNGQAWTVAGLATALRRVWWPAVLVAAAGWPRVRRPSLLALAAAALGARPALLLPSRRTSSGVDAGALGAQVGSMQPAVPARPSAARAMGYGLLDDLSYGAGVWVGCIGQRSLRALLPRVAPHSLGPPPGGAGVVEGPPPGGAGVVGGPPPGGPPPGGAGVVEGPPPGPPRPGWTVGTYLSRPPTQKPPGS